MSIFSKLFSGGASALIETVGSTVDRFVTTDKERGELKIELQRLIQERESEVEETIRQELSSKEKVLVAELAQGDSFTKRARPTVVYAGLIFIFLNYCLVPIIQSIAGADINPFPLPTQFWVAWGGIVGTWSIGRSLEKSGTQNKLTSAITGNKTRASSIFDDDARG